MKKTPILIFLFLSLFIVRPTASYAHWHSRTYVDVNFGVWPSSYYYYGYPPYYYDPFYDPFYDPYPVYSYPAYTYPTYTYPTYTYPTYTYPAAVSSPDYQPVVVNGTTYYVNNGLYYVYTQYGYQAVSAPAGVAATAAPMAAPATASDSVTINIPNKNGGYTPVVLKKSGNGYVGPQGEFYSEFPKVSQLQTMYGK
jgi:hypothetical protein